LKPYKANVLELEIIRSSKISQVQNKNLKQNKKEIFCNPFSSHTRKEIESGSEGI
jgi:hypothetical protein